MSETRKITVKARALKSGNANFISIVDRGANRLPVQALKNEEKNMFDLDKVFRRQKAERAAAQKSEVSALLVPTTDVDGFVSALKSDNAEQELHVFAVEGKDHVSVISFKSEDETDLSQMLLFQGSEDSPIVAVSGAQKMLHDWGYDSDQGFAGSVVSNGFYSNARSACDVYMSALWDIMEKAESNPTESINALTDEFKGYMTALVSNVPSEAFKFESLRPVVSEEETDEVQKGESGEEDTTDGAAATDTNDTVEGDTNAKTEDDPKTDEAAKGDAATAGTDATGSEGEQVVEGQTEEDAPKTDAAKSEGEADPMAQLIAALGNLPEAVTTLTETVNGLKSELAEVKEGVTEAQETAAKAENAATQNADSLNAAIVETDAGREGQDTALKSEIDDERSVGRNSNIEYH
ncbi:hypothetical protein [Vibrio phage vB_VhaS-a]|nr:hypothetical protein [Vibrio phage vB_VhaS-a]